MENVVNVANFPRAYAEAYAFINALGDTYIRKIPTSMYHTIEKNRDIHYHPKFEANQTMTEGMISKEGIALIAALYLEYWSEDEAQKTQLKQIYASNAKQQEKIEDYVRNKTIFPKSIP